MLIVSQFYEVLINLLTEHSTMKISIYPFHGLMALETSEQILYDHSFLLNPKLFPSCFGERN